MTTQKKPGFLAGLFFELAVLISFPVFMVQSRHFEEVRATND